MRNVVHKYARASILGIMCLLATSIAESGDLDYSTYFGGAYTDAVNAVAVAGGKIYLTGRADNADGTASPFPTTPGAYDTSGHGGAGYTDAFVAVLAPNGNGSADLLYSTILGGASWDVGYDIAVAGGQVFVVGITNSTDFPVTAGAFDAGTDSSNNAFVAIFDSSLSNLQYCSLLRGSSNSENGWSIAVDDGLVYLSGDTNASDFPTTAGAFATSNAGSPGSQDVFLTVLNPAGTGAADLVYSTYLGGTGSDQTWSGCLVVANGKAYLTGTAGVAFPTTIGAYDTSHAGATDVFVAIVSPDGNGAADLVASTLLGSSHGDAGYGIAVAGNQVYVTGSTTWQSNITMAEQFPTTLGAWDRLLGDGYMPHDEDETDAFLAVLNGSLSSLVYSSFLGGTANDLGRGIGVVGGRAFIAGSTYADATVDQLFPTTPDAYDTTPNGVNDLFVSVLDPSGNGSQDLLYSTFLGGGSSDFASSIAVSEPLVVVGGVTLSDSWPTSTGSFDESSNGFDDGCVVVLPIADFDLIFADGFESGGLTFWN